MKRTKWITALMLVFVPLIAAAQLQQNEQMAVQVPFKFTIGNMTVPAGRYTVQRHGDMRWVLVLANRDAKVATFARAAITEAKNAAPTGGLVFHKYGDRYFLESIKIPGTPTAYEFRQSKLEREMLAQNGSVPELVLLASSK